MLDTKARQLPGLFLFILFRTSDPDIPTTKTDIDIFSNNHIPISQLDFYPSHHHQDFSFIQEQLASAWVTI